MLPAALRMRRSDVPLTIRRGARAACDTVVVHCRVASHPGTRVAFVVGRTVGGAVVRNKVRRRLRGVVVEHSESLPAGRDVVVRALPAAAAASYARLNDDVVSALRGAEQGALTGRGPARRGSSGRRGGSTAESAQAL